VLQVHHSPDPANPALANIGGGHDRGLARGTTCDGKQVGDGVINIFDIAAVLAWIFRASHDHIYRGLPNTPGLVLTYEGQPSLAKACGPGMKNTTTSRPMPPTSASSSMPLLHSAGSGAGGRCSPTPRPTTPRAQRGTPRTSRAAGRRRRRRCRRRPTAGCLARRPAATSRSQRGVARRVAPAHGHLPPPAA